MKYLSILISVSFCASLSLPTALLAGENLVQNPGFETTGSWSTSGSAGRVNANAHTGSYSMRPTSGDNGASQTISVNPNTTYTLTAWGKKDSRLGYLIIFVKNYGGADIFQYFTSTSYAQKSITFTPTASSCVIGVWAWNGSGSGYADDFVLTGSSPTSTPTPTPTPVAGVAPNAPSALKGTAASATQINLSWSDNATTENGFKIERSISGAAFTQIAIVAANIREYTNAGLAASTNYYYRVRAYNSYGDSIFSNAATATTLATATPTPTPTATASPTPTPSPQVRREIWVAVRTDGLPGIGTQTDPYDGSTMVKFDAIMSDYNKTPPYTAIKLGPGLFRTAGTRTWHVRPGWVIDGAGMYLTTVQQGGNVSTIPGVACFQSDPNIAADYVTISDLTVDCNWPELSTTAPVGAGGEKNFLAAAIMIWGSNNLIDRVRSINSYGSAANHREHSAILLVGPRSADGTNDIIQFCRAEQPWGNYGNPFGLSGWINSAPTHLITNSKVVSSYAGGVNDGLPNGFTSGGVNLCNVKDCQIDGNTFVDCYAASYQDTGSCDGLRVTNNTVIRGWEGVGLASPTLPSQNIKITGNNFSIQNRVPGGGSYGIVVAYGVTITNLTIDTNTITFDTSGRGMQQFYGVEASFLTTATISNNIIGVGPHGTFNDVSGLGLTMFNNRTPAGALIPTLNNQ